LMLRWTSGGKFRGNLVVKVPECRHKDWACKNPPEWTEKVDKLAVDERLAMNEREAKRRKEWAKAHRGDMSKYKPLDQNFINAYYRSRVCASFPALMLLKDEKTNEPLRLSEAEWLEKTKSGEWKAGKKGFDPYFDNLSEIIASSGKIAMLESRINFFKGFRDAEGKPPRQIISSCFFVTTYLIKLVRYISM